MSVGKAEIRHNPLLINGGHKPGDTSTRRDYLIRSKGLEDFNGKEEMVIAIIWSVVLF